MRVREHYSGDADLTNMPNGFGVDRSSTLGNPGRTKHEAPVRTGIPNAPSAKLENADGRAAVVLPYRQYSGGMDATALHVDMTGSDNE